MLFQQRRNQTEMRNVNSLALETLRVPDLELDLVGIPAHRSNKSPNGILLWHRIIQPRDAGENR